ncbi:MAG: hypothetical protein J3K34DRAFT_470781 [Monoraphidium minutum]|nr:MAG: hypothetical protein J3K34DRAFT_470781 [Monoraphidium minutum]
MLSTSRDTAAGRALFALYGGQQDAVQTGVRFSARNRRRFARHAAVRPAPQPVAAPPPPARPKVAVPRVGRAAAGGSAPAQPAIPRRRPAALILSDLRAAADEAAAGGAPLPAGPLLDDAEKQRLALMMQHRGKPPEPAGSRARGGGDAGSDRGAGGGDSAARQRGPAGGEARRLQARFDVVAGEVAEREAWQAAMARDGLARAGHAAVIKAEVAERAAEMARIDARLRELEGRHGGA